MFFAGELEAEGAVDSGVDGVAFEVEVFAKAEEDGGVVFDDQDGGHLNLKLRIKS